MNTVIRLEIDIKHTRSVSAEELVVACSSLDFVKWAEGKYSVTSGAEVLGDVLRIRSEMCGQFL